MSTVVLSALGRRRTGSASSGSNATSHWVWGERAKRRHGTDLRHTALGYGIHHASSIFWALWFERAARGRRARDIAAIGAATAVTAYVVDYHVVPRRLTPGFDRHLTPAGMVATYATFAAGLVVGHLAMTSLQRALKAPPRRASRKRPTAATPGR